MKNKLIVTLLTSLFILVVGCSKGGTSTSDVSGIYKSDSETYTLNADGTGIMDFGSGYKESITWALDGELVTFSTESGVLVTFQYIDENLFLQASGTTFEKVN